MAISGIWGDLLGKDAFSKFGIKLWWEKAHAVCNTLYVFLLFAFGLYSTNKHSACVPTKENVSISEVAGADAFISDLCVTKAPRDTNIASNCFSVIYLALLAELFSIVIVKIWLCYPLSLFSNSEKQHADLKLSLEDMKLLAIQPNVSRKISNIISVSRVREIVSILRKCDKEYVSVAFGLREIYVTVLLALSTFGVIIIVIVAKISLNNPVFDCNFEETENLFWDINGTMSFVCTHPWIEREFSIVYIYMWILSFHLCSRGCGLWYVRLNRAKGTVLFLKTLWACARTPEKKKFGDFVKYIFSDECLKEVKKNIELVGTCADLQFTEMAESFIDVKHVSLKPDLQGLIKNKRWEWIVGLVDKFPKPFDDFSPLMEADITALDLKDDFESGDDQFDSSHERTGHLDASHFTKDSKVSVFKRSRRRIEGRSLLFYVLNREPGSSTFHMHAAKCILEYTRGQERVVCYNGGKISATHFVEMQHASDPTYPDRITDQLLRFIEA